MATLVIMAAGGSTRFGRPKQLEPVTADGRTIADITLCDAFDAGCSHAVFVVRPEHQELFKQRYTNDPRVAVTVQVAALGTAHAALIGMEQVAAPWIVVNGDDHYGKSAIAMACVHAMHPTSAFNALVAFRLANTLSPNGPVNRAVCSVSSEGRLVGLQEMSGLECNSDSVIRSRDGRVVPPDTLVSMNLWVLRSSMLPHLRTQFETYALSGVPREFMLPAEVEYAMRSALEVVDVIPTESTWHGLTYPADADLVRRALSSLP
jgi:hypothetical protein